MNEKLYAIFEVKNERATQTSAALPHTLARNLYERLQAATNVKDSSSRLEIRQVGA